MDMDLKKHGTTSAVSASGEEARRLERSPQLASRSRTALDSPTVCALSHFRSVNSHTNPSTYPLLVLI